jgi:hypothetical protein
MKINFFLIIKRKSFAFFYNINTYKTIIKSVFYLFLKKMDLNKVMLIGRSTNTLQVKTIESTQSSVVNFTIATNRRYKNKE